MSILKTNARTAIVAATAALMGAGAIAPAAAAEPIVISVDRAGYRTAAVDISGYNLMTETGMKAAQRQLDRAARAVCVSDSSARPAAMLRLQTNQCRARAEKRAASQLAALAESGVQYAQARVGFSGQ
ncbi:MAG: UrcA family protein [Pacificimonas sp.]|jgi:UrcA family protein|nr:UrcA family protein [Pacificimonas sp.]